MLSFQANWYKAEQYCRFHGMHLASINSAEEQRNLEEHIQSFGETGRVLSPLTMSSAFYNHEQLGGRDLSSLADLHFSIFNFFPGIFLSFKCGVVGPEPQHHLQSPAGPLLAVVQVCLDSARCLPSRVLWGAGREKSRPEYQISTWDLIALSYRLIATHGELNAVRCLPRQQSSEECQTKLQSPTLNISFKAAKFAKQILPL